MKKTLAFAIILLSVLTTFSQTPNCVWAKGVGVNPDNIGHAVATDASGNILITGWFNSSSSTFGTNILTNVNNI